MRCRRTCCNTFCYSNVAPRRDDASVRQLTADMLTWLISHLTLFHAMKCKMMTRRLACVDCSPIRLGWQRGDACPLNDSLMQAMPSTCRHVLSAAIGPSRGDNSPCRLAITYCACDAITFVNIHLINTDECLPLYATRCCQRDVPGSF